MSKISKIIARQVFDSRGNPTIETEVFVKDISASAICPSGASTGTYEAFEKRDINNKKYLLDCIEQGQNRFGPPGASIRIANSLLKHLGVNNN